MNGERANAADVCIVGSRFCSNSDIVANEILPFDDETNKNARMEI